MSDKKNNEEVKSPEVLNTTEKKSSKLILVVIAVIIVLGALVGGYLLISGGKSTKEPKIEHMSAKKYVGYWYKYSNDIDGQYINIKKYDDDSITFDWYYDERHDYKNVKATFKSKKALTFEIKDAKLEGKIKLGDDEIVITITKAKSSFLSKGQTITLKYQYDKKVGINFTEYKRNKDYKNEKELVANYILTDASIEFLSDQELDDNEKINLAFLNTVSKSVKYEKIDMFKDLEINSEDKDKTITINEKEYKVQDKYSTYNYTDVNDKYKQLFNLELPKETITTDYADYLYDEENELFVEYKNKEISETKNYGIVSSKNQGDKFEVTVAMFNLDNSSNLYFEIKNSSEDGKYYYYGGKNYKEDDFVNYMLDNLSSRLDKVTFVFAKNENDEYYLDSIK